MLVTNNTKQAARVADNTAFFLMGELVEFGPTDADLHGARGQADQRLHHRDGSDERRTASHQTDHGTWTSSTAVPRAEGREHAIREAATITALIGPSGCGKSTLLRCLNRMNDLIPGVQDHGRGAAGRRGHLRPGGATCDELRKRVGMVFQRPNPFPLSVFDNVAFGLRVDGVSDSGDAGGDRGEKPAGRLAVGQRQGQAGPRRPWSCRWTSSSGCASRGSWPWSRR